MRSFPKQLAASAVLLGLLAAGAALPATAASPLSATAAITFPWSSVAVESIAPGDYAATMTVGTAQQLSLRRFGQTGAQEFFKLGDGLAHVHHRVGQPGRVAKEAVQHKTAEYCVFDHRASSFVYCTVFSRCSTRCSAQSPASRT